MIASFHTVDVSARGNAPGAPLAAPARATWPALCGNHTHAPLSGAFPPPPPRIRRIGLIAFWEQELALEQFLGEHPVAAVLAGGWHVRLESHQS